MTMKDKLEKFIDQNRHEFDHLEPSEGLWDKIQENLEEPEIKSVRKKNNFALYALRAAAVLVFGLFSVFIYEQFFDNNQLGNDDPAPVILKNHQKLHLKYRN
jgi:hypothetical protein